MLLVEHSGCGLWDGDKDHAWVNVARCAFNPTLPRPAYITSISPVSPASPTPFREPKCKVCEVASGSRSPW